MTVFLWIVRYAGDEWCCFVVARSRGRAKALFHDYWREGEYTEVRCRKEKAAPETEEGVYDVDCPALEALGVRYLSEAELNYLEVF